MWWYERSGRINGVGSMSGLLFGPRKRSRNNGFRMAGFHCISSLSIVSLFIIIIVSPNQRLPPFNSYSAKAKRYIAGEAVGRVS